MKGKFKEIQFQTHNSHNNLIQYIKRILRNLQIQQKINILGL